MIRFADRFPPMAASGNFVSTIRKKPQIGYVLLTTRVGRRKVVVASLLIVRPVITGVMKRVNVVWMARNQNRHRRHLWSTRDISVQQKSPSGFRGRAFSRAETQLIAVSVRADAVNGS